MDGVEAGAGIKAQETAGVTVGVEMLLPLLGAPVSSFSLVGRRLRRERR